MLFIELHNTRSVVLWEKLPHSITYQPSCEIQWSNHQKTTKSFIFILKHEHTQWLTNSSLKEKHEKLYAKIQKTIVHFVFISRNLHCTQLGSSCLCRILSCCSAQLWKRERRWWRLIHAVQTHRESDRCLNKQWRVLCLPREAQTDLPVAASSMGCFRAMLTLMWMSPTVLPFSCETKTARWV